jgi:hypothetical protein
MIPTNKYDAYWFCLSVYICEVWLTLIAAELIKLWLCYRKVCENKVFQKKIRTSNFMHTLRFKMLVLALQLPLTPFVSSWCLQLMLCIQVHCHFSWIFVSSQLCLIHILEYSCCSTTNNVIYLLFSLIIKLSIFSLTNLGMICIWLSCIQSVCQSNQISNSQIVPYKLMQICREFIHSRLAVNCAS